MLRQPRLLPACIFFAALTLTVKLGAMWQEVEIGMVAPAVAEAKDDAAAEPDAKKADGKGGSEDGVKHAKADARPAEGSPDKHADAAGKPAPDGTKPADDGDDGFDPTQATDAEVELLQKLAARRRELDRRARDIELRQSMLAATERRIETRIAELRKIKSMVEGLLKKHGDEQENKLKSLVKIYESMKPKDAARIFEELDLTILLDVVGRMREARTAPILAKMDPAKAKALTTALAERGTLPPLAEREDGSRK